MLAIELYGVGASSAYEPKLSLGNARAAKQVSRKSRLLSNLRRNRLS